MLNLTETERVSANQKASNTIANLFALHFEKIISTCEEIRIDSEEHERGSLEVVVKAKLTVFNDGKIEIFPRIQYCKQEKVTDNLDKEFVYDPTPDLFGDDSLDTEADIPPVTDHSVKPEAVEAEVMDSNMETQNPALPLLPEAKETEPENSEPLQLPENSSAAKPEDKPKRSRKKKNTDKAETTETAEMPDLPPETPDTKMPDNRCPICHPCGAQCILEAGHGGSHKLDEADRERVEAYDAAHAQTEQ